MAKTYVSRHPRLSVARKHPKDGSRATLYFHEHKDGHGELTTEDPEVMADIEKTDAFKSGVIKVKPAKEVKAVKQEEEKE